jgi:hypothetical protein
LRAVDIGGRRDSGIFRGNGASADLNGKNEIEEVAA